METTIWGPQAWGLLHTICFNYPKNPKFNEKQNLKKYVKSFVENIPCPNCKKSFKEIYSRIPIDNFLNNNYGTFLWSYLVHDIVNQKLNKKSPEFENIVNYYISITKPPHDLNKDKFIKKTFKLYSKYSDGLNYDELLSKGKVINMDYDNIIIIILIISIVINCFLFINLLKKNNNKGVKKSSKTILL